MLLVDFVFKNKNTFLSKLKNTIEFICEKAVSEEMYNLKVMHRIWL